MNLLTRLYTIPRGKILIDGKDINDIPIEVLRNNICYITQDNFLFSSTLKDNISLFKDEYEMEEIKDSTKKAVIYDEISKMPKGIETKIGERGTDLSGGQKQRVAISRAFLKNSSILIFDDTFSALDNRTSQTLLENIQEFSGKKTCIIISNKVADVRNSDKIVVLKNGSIEEDKLLLSSNNKYAPFFILMRYTGMRKEEIVPITIDDVDLKNRTISINKAVTFIHNQPVLKTTKNKKTRTVPILDIIYDLVKDLVNTTINNNRKLLFVKETDKKMLTDVSIKRHLESFIHDLNNANNTEIKFTCHQLRHSYCTMLYYADVRIKKAQELMGHSSADMVYNIYTHLDEKRENAEELINNYIKKLSN